MQLIGAKRTTRRKIWVRRVLILSACTAAVGLWLAKDPALDRYRAWKQQRALAQAREFVQQHDAPKAKVALEVALAARPGNIEAWRVAADILDQVGAPQALKFRRRIVQMAPDSVEDRAALVMTALRAGDYNSARGALADMTPAQASQPVALRAALAFALTTNNNPVADALFDRLRPLYPQNDDLKVSHASLRLRHPDAAKAAAARAELDVLVKNPKYALQIQREFMAVAMQKRDFPEARRWADAIVADSGAVFSDRLQRANLELLIDKRPFAEVFAGLAPKVPEVPADVVQFVRWLTVQNQAAEADKWLASRSAKLREDREVRFVAADLAVELKDWDRVTFLLEGGAWGPIPKDVVRLAMSARVTRERNNTSLQRQIWDEALRATGTSMPALRALQRLASAWQWDDEVERTLWVIARTFPDQTWAHQALFSVYRQRKNTASMRDVMATLRDGDTTVTRYQSDWAILTLMLEPSPAWNQPKEQLKRMYSDDPANPYLATGYAVALAQSGKPAEALTVIETMPETDRSLPARAPYLAYVYGLARRKPELEKYEAVAAGLDLLPEEKRLATLGREAVDRPPPKAAPKAAPATPPPTTKSATKS